MSTIAYRGAPLLALAFCLAASPALADEADSTIIVTAPAATDAAEDRAARTPGGADVVSYRDYADKSVVSLRDTLAFSPGVYLQPRFGQGCGFRSAARGCRAAIICAG
jgi:iron complex outermembrane receptor protein